MNKVNTVSGLVIVLGSIALVGCGLHTDGSGSDDTKVDETPAAPATDGGTTTDADGGTASGCTSSCTPTPAPATDAAPATDGGGGTVPTGGASANISCVSENGGLKLVLTGDIRKSLANGVPSSPTELACAGRNGGDWHIQNSSVKTAFTDLSAKSFTMNVPFALTEFNCAVHNGNGVSDSDYYWFQLNVQPPSGNNEKGWFSASDACEIRGTKIFLK